DTDFGGLADGEEDQNKNGQIDGGETDPNDPRDDKVGQSCTKDADCGASDSGVVCASDTCVLGCRGTGGNGCPMGKQCSSLDAAVGVCMPIGVMPDAGVMEAGGMSMTRDAGVSATPDAGVAHDAGGGAAGSSSKPPA